MAQIKDIVSLMESLAPVGLAEEWDNPGLQVGHMNWPVKNIWIALDPTREVVAKACRNGADLLICHHPLVFKPLKSVDTRTPVGGIIETALRHRLAIYSAHTNLDSAADGLNDYLSFRLGLSGLKILQKRPRNDLFKLVFFVSLNDEQKVLEALFKTPAGRIGDYSSCSFRVQGKGTFKPGPAAQPFIGKKGVVSEAEEIKIETVIQRGDIPQVLEHIQAAQSYETMAYDIYPLYLSETRLGLGRTGQLEKPIKLFDFVKKIKQVLKIQTVRVVGKPDRRVQSVAVSSGSGSSLVDAFLSSGADVFVSGDLSYHNARAVEAAGLALIDVGHFGSERIVIDLLAEKLQSVLKEKRWDIKVHKAKIEKEPFLVL